MGRYREFAVVVFGPNRRNGVTLLVVGVLVVLAYVVLPRLPVATAMLAGIQYAVGLAVFCIWMAWFVAAGVAVWRTGAFGQSS